MKIQSILIALTILFIAHSKALAQDAAFTQWENMLLYVNPALTGNFDGSLRLRAKYRNQWRSLLKENSFQTSAVSAEYKFSKGSARKISVGAFGIHDKAGSLNTRNNALNFSASITQNLGNPDRSPHSIAIGLSVGLANKKIDYRAQWPGGMPPEDINERTNYADVSVGLLWQYRSSTHFSFQLGSALHHLNRPNVSFFTTNVVRLYQRFNLHGHVEIPLVHNISIVPSFLFSSQGPSEQLLFGFHGKWYPKSLSSNFVQLGIFGKSTKDIYGSDINIFVLSAMVEINSILFGFSLDHFEAIGSNAHEFSLGYTIGRHHRMSDN